MQKSKLHFKFNVIILSKPKWHKGDYISNIYLQIYLQYNFMHWLIW